MAWVYPLDYGPPVPESKIRTKPVSAPRIYRGLRRDRERIVQVIQGEAKTRALDPRLDIHAYTQDSLEWATGYAAPRQLAIAILADVTDNRQIALSYHQDFKCEIVNELDWEGWDLTEEDILNWLTRKALAELEATLSPARRRARMQLA
jgi:hypothetical protein